MPRAMNGRMPTRTTTVELEERLGAFAEAKVAQGRSADEAAVLETGLWLLQEHER